MKDLSALGNWVASIVRTSVVPAIVGVLAAAALYANTELPPDTAAILTTGFAIAYWAFVRLLEMKFPKAGWLLLFPRPPAYSAEHVKEFGRSALRTFTPYIVGLVITFAARHGFDLSDSKMATSLIAVITSGVFYSGVRAVETSTPKAGLLLGGPRALGAPNYEPSAEGDL